MAFYALLFRPGAHAQTSIVVADATADDGETLRLLRDGAVVWRGPKATVAEAIPFDTQKDAKERCQAHREQVGQAHGATLALTEAAAAGRPGRRAKRGRTSIPAEGVRIVLED